MPWRIGIDEAGYGPNLGPFVMTAVAVQTHDPRVNLWRQLKRAIRRVEDFTDDRLVVGDSKKVYSPQRGLRDLERSALAMVRGGAFPPAPVIFRLRDLLDHLSPHYHPYVHNEIWYKGELALPHVADTWAVSNAADAFREVLDSEGMEVPLIRSAIVCPLWFNALIDRHGTKAAVPAETLTDLLRVCWTNAPEGMPLLVDIDKQGGRNHYSALLQPAFDPGVVLARGESFACSVYEVKGLPHPIRITLRPRADADCFAVALASMVSKYLRELLMLEFNAFWRAQLPQLKPTAGYPTDARRFWQEILPALKRLPLREDQVWRKK